VEIALSLVATDQPTHDGREAVQERHARCAPLGGQDEATR
jgi:hypothetical protein